MNRSFHTAIAIPVNATLGDVRLFAVAFLFSLSLLLIINLLVLGLLRLA